METEQGPAKTSTGRSEVGSAEGAQLEPWFRRNERPLALLGLTALMLGLTALIASGWDHWLGGKHGSGPGRLGVVGVAGIWLLVVTSVLRVAEEQIGVAQLRCVVMFGAGGSVAMSLHLMRCRDVATAAGQTWAGVSCVLAIALVNAAVVCVAVRSVPHFARR